MDVVKPKPTHGAISSKTLLAAAFAVAVIFVVLYTKNSLNAASLARKDILIATVQYGDLELTVEGFGTLRSARQQILTTLTTATVQEIVLKPGAAVVEGSVIVILSNPEMQQQVENAQQELEQTKANLRQLLVNHKREILDEKATLTELSARYETARLRRAAEERLVESGTVSDLTFKESVSNENQLRQRIDILRERSKQLASVHREAINIQKERVKQQLGQLDSANNRLDKLSVRANFDGVLQRSSVELGQSLAAGQQVALIGSVTELIALVRIPQSKAQQVAVGQTVSVDTRLDEIDGEVVRIDPIVENSTVQVEVALRRDLPGSAIPNQNVDARILTATLNDTHYIRRPANVRADSDTSLYKLNESTSLADRTRITLGKESARYIEITSGASAGERFIISDLSNYDDAQIVIE